MKIIMTLIMGSLFLIPQLLNAQILPNESSDAWRRNANNTAGGSGNIFGTKSWNSPVFFHTAAALAPPYTGMRMKLSGQFSAGNQYSVAGYSWPSINTTGYLGLGDNKDQIWTSTSRGPYSLLHLNGRDGGFVQSGGFRPWMKTGITLTDNQDLSYIGLRKIGPGLDKTETAIVWADNVDNANGPDELAFRFTAGTNDGSLSPSSDKNAATDYDGKMIAQFSGKGNMGLGQIFEPGPTGQKASSRLHVAKIDGGSPSLNPNPNEVWAQITNHITNHTANDGLRLGANRIPIGGGEFQTNGYLRWQEETPFIIQTDANDSPGGINNGERMRISSINAPDVPNPAGLNINTTRVSIPIFGNIPLDEPRSLLHLGFELGDATGIRPWMNLGTTTAGFGTFTYMGMKEEGLSPEPVLAWGDFNNTGLPIVYTSDAAGTGNAPEGLEVARFSSAVTAYGGDGGLGVGDFSGSTPTHKLHVRGNARFENVPDPINPGYVLLGKQVGGPADIELAKLALTYDTDDVLLGNGTWGPGGAGTDDQSIEIFDFDCVSNLLTLQLEDGGTVTADLSCLDGGGGGEDDDWYTSGTTTAPDDIADDIYTNGLVGINTAVTPLAQLEIKGDNIHDPLWVNGAHAKFKILEEGNFGLGGNPVLGSHLINVRDADLDFSNTSHAVNMEFSNSAGNGLNVAHGSIGLNSSGIFSSIRGIGNVNGVYAEAIHSLATVNTGLYARARNAAQSSIGIFGEIPGGMGVTPTGATIGLNALNTANLGIEHYGVKSLVRSQTNGSTQYGVYGDVAVNSTSTPLICYGGWFKAKSGGTNIGVYGEAGYDAGDDWAAHFNGDGKILTEFWVYSDSQFKRNINDIGRASEILEQLSPKSYDFKNEEFPSINFPKEHQYGLIAQELEKILPALVKTTKHPEQKDENGRVIQKAIEHKVVKYNALVPILIQGHKEQKEEIDLLKNNIDQLNERLAKIEALLKTDDANQSDRATQNVQLNNAKSIVLDQNVPNPFAEETTIAYEIPNGFNKAQMHFFDQQGKIIKTVDLKQSGKGSIRVFGEQLSQGIYTYTLVVDGKVIASKKMIKATY